MRRLTLAAEHLPLARPFRISRGERTVADVVTVAIEQDGVTGRGEGVPYSRYNLDIAGVVAAAESVRAAIEAGAGRDELMTLLPAGAARNALDCALWDLESRLAGRSIAALTDGAPPAPIASAITIGIEPLDTIEAAAAALANAPVLKLKVDAVRPADRIRAARAGAPAAQLIVDPNEAWDERMLRDLEPVLVEARVALIEQPVAARDDAWLEGYTAPVPICADESVHVAADLDRVGARYDVVNVKLDKTGGLTEALALARGARDRGLGLMTGCMVSSSLSIAPAWAVAAKSDFVDLDGPLWLAQDRAGGVRDEGGWLQPPAPGFWGAA